MVIKCHLCSKEFPKPSKLKLHFSSNHCCKWCKSEVADKAELKLHLSSCENFSLFKFRCENCGKTNDHKGHHEVHVEKCLLNNKRPKTFKCVKCDKSFKNLQTKESHEARHSKEEQFPCIDCEKQFNSKKDLLDHEITHKKIDCNYCNLQFRKGYIQKHIERKHHIVKAGVSMFVSQKKKPSFSCHLCTKVFLQEKRLEKHLTNVHKTNIESKDKPTVACDECSFKFLNSLSLELHKKSIHGQNNARKSLNKELNCDECSKTFRSAKLKRNHMKFMHSSNEVIFKCDLCPYATKRKFHLRRHFKQRHGENKEKLISDKSLSRSHAYRKAKNIIEHMNGSNLEVKKIIENNLREDNAVNDSENTLSDNDVFDVIKHANLTDNQIIKVSNVINKKTGKQICPGQLKKKLCEKKKVFKSSFNLEKIVVVDKKGNESLKDAVVGNVVNVRNTLQDIRGTDMCETVTIVGVDGGKGMLKVACNFVGETDPEDEYNLAGARKSIVLFASPGMDETYENISAAFEKTKVGDIECKMSMDLKCLSLCIGIQSQSSKHPCVYCNAEYDAKKSIWKLSPSDRTFAQIKENNDNWMRETKGNKEKLKHYFNCIHPPMKCFDNYLEMKVIDKCPPPPLHVCKLGPFNHIIKNLAKLCPDEVKKFIKTVQVSPEKYHGGDYEGNEIDKCLRNIGELEKLLTDEYFEFIEAFKSIKELNDHVAGRKLKDGFEEVIDRFSINFLNLNANHNVSITPKIHIIINHVKEYCRRTKCSLGSCSDQTIEAVHQVVNNRFRLPNIT